MKRILSGIALLLLCATAAFAGQDKACPLTLQAGTGVVGQADFDEGDGGFSVVEADLSATYDMLTLAYGVRSYDWDDEASLPFGNGVDEPWETLHELELSLGSSGRIDERWGWFANLGLSAAWEEEMDDALGVSAMGGVNYALTRQWVVMMGLRASGHQVGWSVLPVAAAVWNQGVEEGFSVSIGLPQSELQYRFNPSWAVRLYGKMDSGLWRLADDSTVRAEGYMKESSKVVGLVGEWAPMERMIVTFGPRVYLDREVTFYNKDGDTQDSHDLGTAYGAQLNLIWSF